MTGLHPDLEPYLFDSSFGRCLKHPLVFSVPYFGEVENERINDMYAWKLQVIEEYKAARNYHGYVWAHERAYRAQALCDLPQWQLSPKAWWELVGKVWVDSENVWQNMDLWRAVWGRDVPRRWLAMHPVERDVLRLLRAAEGSESVTVYRGAARRLNEDGLSWTLNVSYAHRFATRFAARRRACIVTGTVNLADVWAYFERRGEQEVVSDAVQITGRKLLERDEGAA